MVNLFLPQFMVRNHSDDEDGTGTWLDRRSLLKTVSLTLLGTAGVSTMGSAAAETREPASGSDLRRTLSNVQNGDIIRLEADGRYTLSGDVTVRADNWTLEGNGATITGSGSYNDIKLTGDGYDVGGFYIDGPDDWTIRWILKGGNWGFHNVAYLNRFGSSAQHYLLVTNESGGTTSRISDVWFGEGTVPGTQESAIKMHWSPGTIGDILVERTYFYQNGTYLTITSGVPNGGVHFRDCYFQSCYNGNIRTGTGSTCTVDNCVVVVNDSEKPSGNSRGIWAFHGPVEVRNTQITTPSDTALNVSAGNPGSIDFRDGEYIGSLSGESNITIRNSGSNPKESPPENCPQGPSEAVAGSSADPDEFDYTLYLNGQGVASDYEFQVSENLEWVLIDDATRPGRFTDVGDQRVDGWTTNEADAYGLNGEITDFSVNEGEPLIRVNGDVVTPEGAIEKTQDGESRTPPTADFPTTVEDVVIVATEAVEPGDGEIVAYDWTLLDSDGNSIDSSSNATAELAHDGPGLYEVELSVEDEFGESDQAVAEVSVEDTQVSLNNTVEIRGTGVRTNYQFEVSDEVIAHPEEDNLQPWDTIDGTVAEGWVTKPENVDTYSFGGEITEFTFLEGEADIYVNGEQINPGRIGNRTIRLKGTGTATNYQFTVSGELAGDGNLEQWDTVSETSADGWITKPEHTDTFVFTGEVTEFGFQQGEAEVYVDGEQTDPANLG